MTHGKTYNKPSRRINHKARKSKTNTGTTALERSVEQATGGFKVLLQLANFTLGPDATLNSETHKNSVRIEQNEIKHKLYLMLDTFLSYTYFLSNMSGTYFAYKMKHSSFCKAYYIE